MAIIKKELKQKRWSIIAYSVVAVLLLWMYVAIFPSFQAESQKFSELLDSYPKALLEAFNIDSLELSTLEGYLAAEQFSLVLPIMLIMMVLAFAAGSVAGEVEKGSMGLMLSLPKNRKNIFASKYTAGLIALVIFCTAAVFTIIPLASINSLSVGTAKICATFILCLVFGWTIMSLGFGVAGFAKEKSTVYFTVGGALLLMYALNIVSGLVSNLDWVKYSSIFYYFQPSNVIMTGTLNKASVLTLAIVAVVATSLGLVRFVRRDISV